MSGFPKLLHSAAVAQLVFVRSMRAFGIVIVLLLSVLQSRAGGSVDWQSYALPILQKHPECVADLVLVGW